MMVCLGAHFSAIWIVVANSWQQTPAGFEIAGEGLKARAVITNFWEMVFNPSSMDRLSHVIMGAWQAGAFLVLSVSAYYLLKKKNQDFAKASMKIALVVAVVASLGQLATGHKSAIGVAKNQPPKLAAFEGHYEEYAPGALYLFGWVDEKEEKVKYGIKIPHLLSTLISGNPNLPIKGLRSFSKDEIPPVNFVFQVYHGMIAIGFFLIGLSLLGLIALYKNRLFKSPWLLKLFVIAVLGPQIANQLGWFSAEVGRQPWIVYGLLRTSDALSKVVTANMVLSSLIMFTLLYLLLFVLFIFLLDQKIRKGPLEEDLLMNKGLMKRSRAEA
ncbi:hypothetical protein BVX98_05715 [bacterium F11]|nr:hypothetical protein BVX98_05715 [bacterium F11]